MCDSREGLHETLPNNRNAKDERFPSLPLTGRISQVCKLVVGACRHKLKVQEDTFTPLSPSLRLNERPKPVRPMLEDTSKVQEAMDCLGDVEGRDAKLSANRIIRQWSFSQVEARADNAPEGGHICRVDGSARADSVFLPCSCAMQGARCDAG